MDRPRTAVVIDDHASLLEVIVEMLEYHGWEVRGFQRVDEALPVIRAQLPDVVLTDINVGVMSGAALARELRLDPATANLTLVAMSGSVRPTPGMARLFDEFLFKPIDITGLDGLLGHAIARRRMG
jgi:CheY-like chemotaxis protein